jgi:hypothetical protein
MISSSSSVTVNLEANKYKTLMKFSLTDLDMVKGRDGKNSLFFWRKSRLFLVRFCLNLVCFLVAS